SRRRHTRWPRDWSSDVCSSDLAIAGIQERGEQEEHGRRGPGGYEDLVGRDRHAVARKVMLRDGLAQGHEPEAVRVPGPAVLEGLLGRFPDYGRCVEIGFAELEVDDVGTLPLQLLGALENLDGQERGDGARAPGDHDEALG